MRHECREQEFVNLGKQETRLATESRKWGKQKPGTTQIGKKQMETAQTGIKNGGTSSR